MNHKCEFLNYFHPKLVTKNNKVCTGEYTHTHVHIYDVINVYAMCITGVVLRSAKYNTPNICMWIWCTYNIYIWSMYMGDFWFKWINCVHHYCTSLRYSKRIFKQEKYDTYVIIISLTPSHPHNDHRHYHPARTYIQCHIANKSLGRKKNILSFSITISGTRAYILDS